MRRVDNDGFFQGFFKPQKILDGMVGPLKCVSGSVSTDALLIKRSLFWIDNIQKGGAGGRRNVLIF